MSDDGKDPEYVRGVIASLREQAARKLADAASLEASITGDVCYVEVPVTERRPVTRIGWLSITEARCASRITYDLTVAPEPFVALPVGTLFVVRPPLDGAPLRAGLGRVEHGHALDLSQIPAACDGDIVYRVEPR